MHKIFCITKDYFWAKIILLGCSLVWAFQLLRPDSDLFLNNSYYSPFSALAPQDTWGLFYLFISIINIINIFYIKLRLSVLGNLLNIIGCMMISMLSFISGPYSPGWLLYLVLTIISILICVKDEYYHGK